MHFTPSARKSIISKTTHIYTTVSLLNIGSPASSTIESVASSRPLLFFLFFGLRVVSTGTNKTAAVVESSSSKTASEGLLALREPSDVVGGASTGGGVSGAIKDSVRLRPSCTPLATVRLWPRLKPEEGCDDAISAQLSTWTGAPAAPSFVGEVRFAREREHGS